jgi:hypothetical protein
MALPMLAQDKANHVIYGFVIAVVAAVVAVALKLPQPKLIGIAVAVLFGAAKEGFDYAMNKKETAAGQAPTHGVDKFDFIATGAGGLAYYLVSMLS